MRQLLITILLAFTTLAIFAQTDSTKVKKKKKVDYVTLSGYVADGFTKAAIPDVQVTLMREDSTVYAFQKVYKNDYESSSVTTLYYFGIPHEPAKYIIKSEHPNYETTYTNYEIKHISKRATNIDGPRIYMKKTANAHHFEGGLLKEVVVQATKVKMVWRGDTLVFNADAFNVPEGSMLDGLIKQLPGVELNDDGEIFVNGKKIDNLTLNGADFFKGKNKIMLENLPYFTVKNVEVYKKQTEKNKFLGIDNEDQKEYTMDIILKREYNIGGSANIETGGGASDEGDWRYKLKAFGLRFSDRTRSVLFGGLNNINESAEFYGGEEYHDRTNQSGDNHFKQIGGQFVYHAPEDKFESTTEVNATWNDERTEHRSQSETYMTDASTFALSDGIGKRQANNLRFSNTLRATSSKYRFYSNLQANYSQSDYKNDGWNVSTADMLMLDSINSSWYRTHNKNNNFFVNGHFELNRRMQSGDAITLNFDGYYYKFLKAESSNLNYYTYHKLGTHDMRDQLAKNPGHRAEGKATLEYTYHIGGAFYLTPTAGFQIDDEKSCSHEFLRDSIDYLSDTQNSYDQHTQTIDKSAGVRFNFSKGFHKNDISHSLYVSGRLHTNFQQKKMDYMSDPLTTNITRNYTLFDPELYANYSRYDSIQTQSVNLRYSVWNFTPDVTDLIDRPNTSNPLNIYQGNPDLKPYSTHSLSTEYSIRRDSIDQVIRFNLSGEWTHNSWESGYTYDLTTGVRTYRPENIKSGNWSTSLKTTWNRALGKKKFWYIDNSLTLQYRKSTGLSFSADSTNAEPLRVGTSEITFSTKARFQNKKLNLNMKGDVSYRNFHRNITIGEQPTDIWDFSYGLNGNYKLPWNFTIETDLTIHSRRGYTDSEMNDNRLYWDATLTKSIQQGRWVFKLRGYDILGQVSSLQYWVSAQGRTEYWTNSMRRYALLTVSYRFSQKPKKDKNAE